MTVSELAVRRTRQVAAHPNRGLKRVDISLDSGDECPACVSKPVHSGGDVWFLCVHVLALRTLTLDGKTEWFRSLFLPATGTRRKNAAAIDDGEEECCKKTQLSQKANCKSERVWN